MRKYGCLRGIAKSFYSPDLYRDVAVNWGGEIVLYLFLLLALCWGCLVVPVQQIINSAYADFSQKTLPQIPDMSIKNGELVTPEARPYIIKDLSDNSIIAVIDTSGEYKSLDKTPAVLLITKNAIFYQSKSKLGRSHAFATDLNVEVKHDQLDHLLKIGTSWAWLILFPLFVMASFIYRIVEAVFYAIIGEIAAHIMKINLTYGQLFRISIFAMTPSIILGAILDWCAISFEYMWIMYFALSMIYLYFGIRANKIAKV